MYGLSPRRIPNSDITIIFKATQLIFPHVVYLEFIAGFDLHV